MPRRQLGFLLGASAYLMWGVFPLYWRLLEPAGALEILAHRVLWSLLAMLALVVLLKRGRQFRAIYTVPRTRRLLLLASVVIAINWGVFIWGVNHHRVVETALGYFINPLVTVVMAVVLLGERLRRLQWIAIGIASVAVIGIAVEYGQVPWVSLVLAFSFGTYGLAKKQANVEAVESLTFETVALVPVAVAYLVWLGLRGQGHFLSAGPGHTALLAASGVVTAIPLLCFGAAAIRVPLTTLGLLQYLAPILQFLLGVTVLGEHMSLWRWVGFCLVWVALAIFTFEALRHRHRQLALMAESVAA